MKVKIHEFKFFKFFDKTKSSLQTSKDPEYMELLNPGLTAKKFRKSPGLRSKTRKLSN